jgi:heat shock protein HslJ
MIGKIVLATVVLFLCGCGASAPTQGPDPLASSSWALATLNGEPVDYSVGITLAFSSGGTLNGSDGCNDYTAGYTLDGGSLTILSPVGTTQKACPPEKLQAGAMYLRALTDTASYRLEGDKLSFLSSDGTVAASFQKVNP